LLGHENVSFPNGRFLTNRWQQPIFCTATTIFIEDREFLKKKEKAGWFNQRWKHAFLSFGPPWMGGIDTDAV